MDKVESKKNTIVMLACFVASAGLVFSLGYARVTKKRPPPPPKLLNIKTSQVLGSRVNNPRTPILVEFFDYECPPCKSVNTFVELLIKNNTDKIELRRRHFPLKMHKNAEVAAVFSEQCKIIGKVPDIHQILITEDAINSSYIADISKKYKISNSDLSLSLQKSTAIVKEDIEAGKIIGVQGTPTFYLCKDDRVYEIKDLKQVVSFLDHKK